jgi:glycerol uptake facilitator-like aquaporin
VALILTLAPVSGAHLNPAVSLALACRGELRWRLVPGYVLAQCTGGLLGAAAAHVMFGLPAWFASRRERAGGGQLLGELLATAGLLLVVLGGARRRPAAMPFAVAAWIAAAYWFTSSTSFANPAVTLARATSDTFSGIRPGDVPAFVLAQLAGAGTALAVGRVMFPPRVEHDS